MKLLRISHLTVHYGAAQALFGVDLAVGRGETLALVSAIGAGKTNLLKAVLGIRAHLRVLGQVRRPPIHNRRGWRFYVIIWQTIA